MERTLGFSNVTDYDFSLMGPDMILELSQGDIVTRIHIATCKTTPKSSQLVEVHPKPKVRTQMEVVQKTSKLAPKTKRAAAAKMTAEQVKEIRANWDQTVKACGTKNAAAEQLGKIYHCSAKNIYAIIYKYSWAHI